MFNIFRMHMYRVSKATSTWVMGIVLAAFMLLSLGLFIFIYNNPLTFMADAISVSMNGEGLRLYPSDTLYLFVQSNDALLILIAIFCVILTNCDFTWGFAKNTYCLFKKKTELIMGKWLAMVTCVSGVYIVCSFFGLLSSALFLRPFRPEGWDEFILGFFVGYLCLISLCTMVFFITSLLKSPAAGMIMGILIATGIFVTGERLLDLLIARIGGASSFEMTQVMAGTASYFRISDYCLDNVFVSYKGSMGAGDQIRTVIVSLVYLALALGLTIYFAEKKDVRT